MTDCVSPYLARPLCRHCGLNPAGRPRGLCWGCYYRPGVRDLYGPLSKFGRRGIGAGKLAPRRRPPYPTTARPGSAEKVRVLEERAAAGHLLWHPLDAAG